MNKKPNKQTIKALNESLKNQKRFKTTEELFKDLNRPPRKKKVAR